MHMLTTWSLKIFSIHLSINKFISCQCFKYFEFSGRLRIFILLPTKICFDLMILKVGDLQWSLRKCNNVYVIIIPKIDAMKVTLSSINVFFLQGIKPLNEENFSSTKIQ